MIRKLVHEELVGILRSIDREQHFLYASYLTGIPCSISPSLQSEDEPTTKHPLDYVSLRGVLFVRFISVIRKCCRVHRPSGSLRERRPPC